MSHGGEDMYREHILEHYKNPRNFGVLEPADIDHREDNPLCGDEIRVMARVDGAGFGDVRFHGRGCAISQASASLLLERVKSGSVAEAKALTRDDVVAMLGIPVSPVRLKCALLGHAVLLEGIARWESGGPQSGGGSESKR